MIRCDILLFPDELTTVLLRVKQDHCKKYSRAEISDRDAAILSGNPRHHDLSVNVSDNKGCVRAGFVFCRNKNPCESRVRTKRRFRTVGACFSEVDKW
jgi:hypothetical protein